MAKKEARKRSSRRRAPTAVSSKSIRKRLREVLVDGFGSPFIHITGDNVDALRSAMAEVAQEDILWEGLREIAVLSDRMGEVRRHIRALK